MEQEEVLERVVPPVLDFPQTWWESFWRKELGIVGLSRDSAKLLRPEVAVLLGANRIGESDVVCSFGQVSMPVGRAGLSRQIALPQGLTEQRLFGHLMTIFPCTKYTDASLDQEVVFNERDARQASYVIWTRDQVEADKELKCVSANDLRVRGKSTMTLLEYLAYALVYYRETEFLVRDGSIPPRVQGQHLDIRDWTLCAGTRLVGGGVPYCSWRDVDKGRLDIVSVPVEFARDYVRAREVSP